MEMTHLDYIYIICFLLQGTYSAIVPYIVPMALCVIVIPVVLTLKETMGKPLEDVYSSQTLPPPEQEKNTSKL